MICNIHAVALNVSCRLVHFILAYSYACLILKMTVLFVLS